MNFQLLGNLVPHLHARIVPRYYGDPAPGRPLDLGDQMVRLAPQEYEERVRLIQEAPAWLTVHVWTETYPTMAMSSMVGWR